MFAVIVLLTVCNAALALSASVVNFRAKKACYPVNRLLAWGCLVFAATRLLMLCPTVSPENNAVSVLAAVLADTAVLGVILAYGTRPCVARRGYRPFSSRSTTSTTSVRKDPPCSASSSPP